jgi:hypothetical protein
MDTSISLNNNEVVSLVLGADLNGDGLIDYEEFMKHFRDILAMVRFQKKLHQIYLDMHGSDAGKKKTGEKA